MRTILSSGVNYLYSNSEQELFEYSQEDFDTGIGDIDMIEDERAYSLSMTMNNGNNTDFVANENLSKSGTVVAVVSCSTQQVNYLRKILQQHLPQ